jgi:predicted AlkP superfamily phosphohydrolase/phosphomutase
MTQRVMVIGLDCADPKLLFEEFRDELPNLGMLMAAGVYGPMRSTDPPITVPAWTAMVTSKDPGQLGFYGFRNRADYSYDGMAFANSALVKEPAIWDILTGAGQRSIVIGVPQTYPPKQINGLMVCDWLTPNKKLTWTYPDSLKDEVEKVTDGYMLDVDNFRTDEKDRLLKQIYEMTEKRFRLAGHLALNESWDFLMMVEMGPDRLHHGFWRFHDRHHRLYEPGHPFETAIKDYYIYLDKCLGELLAQVDGETTVLVVSDHGIKGMAGGICVNDWLISEGYLTLKETPASPVRLTPDMIDWSKTVAWGEGGYYSRVCMNVAGREPQGLVPAADYQAVRDRLKAGLEEITDENGANIGTKVLYAEDIYKQNNGIAPDMLVYFGNLDWRSIGTVGNDAVQVFSNDTGPDDANHDFNGIFMMAGPGIEQRGRQAVSIYDVAPTVLKLLGHEPPADMIGRSLV